MPFFTSSRRRNNDLGFGSSVGTRRRGQTDTSSSSTLLPTTIAAERRSHGLNHQVTNNTCNSFLLGGNYYPGKDKKRRQLRRRALWYRLFCSSPLRKVVSFVCIGFLALWYAIIPISDALFDYGGTITTVQRNTRDYKNWLLLDNSMVMNLPSTKEDRKQAFQLSADRQGLMFGSEGGRQSRLDLLRAISPEWFTRNERENDNAIVHSEKNHEDSGAFAWKEALPASKTTSPPHADAASSRNESPQRKDREASQQLKGAAKGQTNPRNASATAPPIQEEPLGRASSQDVKRNDAKEKQQTVDNGESRRRPHQFTDKKNEQAENAGEQHLATNEQKTEDEHVEKREEATRPQHIANNEGNSMAKALEKEEPGNGRQLANDGGNAEAQKISSNANLPGDFKNDKGTTVVKADATKERDEESLEAHHLGNFEDNPNKQNPQLIQVEDTHKVDNESVDSKVDDKPHPKEDSAAILAKSKLVDDGQSTPHHPGKVLRTLQTMKAFHNMSSCPADLDPSDIRTTLVIQSSQERLWILKETCNRWKDPIIVVVLLSERSTDLSESEESVRESCPQLTLLRHSVDTTGTDENDSRKYPINKLRNLGLDAVQTSHVLMLDIDLVPSQDLQKVVRSSLQNEEQAQSTKQAVVVPAFERIAPNNYCLENGPECIFGDVQNISKPYLPSTFPELAECVLERSECRVFQSSDNPDGHSSTRSATWLEGSWYKNDENGDEQKQTNSVSCFDSLRYEPYVVIRWCPTASMNEEAKPMAPYYDERFYGYGKNKIEYISHLRLLGYQFAILPEGFVIHSPHSPSKVKKEWEGTSSSGLHSDMDKLYHSFLKELFSEYQKQEDKYPIVSPC